jgi:hypothetical protein
MHPVKLLERATSTAVHALRHPVASAAYTAGMARGLVGAALHGATTTGHDTEAGRTTVPPQRAAAPEPGTEPATGPREPQRVMKAVPRPEDLEEPIVIEPDDEEPGESFATEPKAVSRESAHGGGPATDAEIDAWIDEAMARGEDVDVETSVGTTGADIGNNPDTGDADRPEHLTQPLLDPSVAKAIRSESETLRKGADPEPDADS